VLNERVVAVREEAECLPALLAMPAPPRCRSIVVVVVVVDVVAKNDRNAEATEAACDAPAVVADAFSTALRVDCCRSGRSYWF